MKKEKTINLETLELLVKRWTDTEVADPIADRDTLEAIVSWLTGEKVVPGSIINRWRREEIEQKKAFYRPNEE